MQQIAISSIKINPNNPRTIKDDKFKKLVASVKELPEMAEVRPIVVNKDMVILGGNMRYQAMKEAGWKTAPVTIVDWPEDKQRQFVIKDNVSGGEWDWDMLANEYDMLQLENWGVDMPQYLADDMGDNFELTDEPKSDYGQMTFMLSTEQQETVKRALGQMNADAGQTFGNDNSNGNKLYWIVSQWLDNQ